MASASWKSNRTHESGSLLTMANIPSSQRILILLTAGTISSSSMGMSISRERGTHCLPCVLWRTQVGTFNFKATIWTNTRQSISAGTGPDPPTLLENSSLDLEIDGTSTKSGTKRP